MHPTANKAKLGLLCLVLAQSMVAANIVSSKILVASVPVPILLCIRFSLASLMLFPLHWLTKSRKTPLREYFSTLSKKDYAFLLGQAVCAGSLFNFLMFFGLKFTDANLAGIITSALPAIIAMMAWLMLNEKFSAKKLVCVAFATLGLGIIAADKLGSPSMAHSFFGDFIVFAALFPEALYYILCKLHPNRLPVFLIATIMNGINAVIFLIVVACSPLHISGISPQNWIILVLSACSSGLFYIFWLYGSKHVDGMMASLSTAIMPVVTVLLAWIILKENLSMIECAGMALVILSIMAYAKK
ncbi:MAG: DMT family transporter [Legionellaceae bacterium]|nr:DMT family transporter [Legionellaceae bacterium]